MALGHWDIDIGHWTLDIGHWTLGEQGWRSGESARLPPMCPGFDSRIRRHKWAEFVGCKKQNSAPRGFSPGTPVFPSRSLVNMKFGHLLFCRGRERNVPKCKRTCRVIVLAH